MLGLGEFILVYVVFLEQGNLLLWREVSVSLDVMAILLERWNHKAFLLFRFGLRGYRRDLNYYLGFIQLRWDILANGCLLHLLLGVGDRGGRVG
jgi:hypothetical protein